MSAIRGNSYYQIVDGPSWTEAESNAVSIGGHLATVNNQNENDWIGAEFSQEPGRGQETKEG